MKEKKFNINLILILFPIMILAGKIIRWTILKTVLVDMSIGNGMISKILYGTGGFTSFSDSGISDAAGNASVFFRAINIFGLTTTIQFEVYRRSLKQRAVLLTALKQKWTVFILRILWKNRIQNLVCTICGSASSQTWSPPWKPTGAAPLTQR